MKLKTKFQDKNFELGEVVDASYYHGADRIRVNIFTHDKIYDYYYTSIKDFTDHWEDAPEEHYFISNCGEVKPEKGHSLHRDQRIKIGNDFKFKEEAEKAVEKLKAWRQLKDKGLRFKRWVISEKPKTPHIKLVIEAEMDVPDSPYDLDLLFGGEE